MDATGDHSKKRKVMLGVIYATGRDILRKNAGPPAGYAMILEIRKRLSKENKRKRKKSKPWKRKKSVQF